MDELANIANAFSAIIGLLCNFRQEHSSHESVSANQFLEWLNAHHHESLRNVIEADNTFLASIEGMLHLERGVFLDQFSEISKQLAQLLSRVDLFTDISQKMLPNVSLSNEAFKILKTLVESEQSTLDLGHNAHNMVTVLKIIDDQTGLKIGSIDFENENFLHDDLDNLCTFGFLKEVPKKKLSIREFRLTRLGKSYITSFFLTLPSN
jgi:hypothetical protein